DARLASLAARGGRLGHCSRTSVPRARPRRPPGGLPFRRTRQEPPTNARKARALAEIAAVFFGCMATRSTLSVDVGQDHAVDVEGSLDAAEARAGAHEGRPRRAEGGARE